MGLDRLDRAQRAFIEHALHGFRLQRMPQVLGDHQRHARLVGGFDHLPAFVERDRHGLLGDRVLARFGRGDGQRRVRVVRRADIHGIDVRLAQHFPEVRVDRIDPVPLPELGYGILDDIACGSELYLVWKLLVRGQVTAGNASRPDQTHFEWLGHGSWVSLALSDRV